MLPKIVPKKYRSLWRRRLRRRPLLPFLLAATLAVDLLLAVSLNVRLETLTTVAGFGFLLAQVGLLTVWSLHTTRLIAQRLLLAIGASIVFGWWYFTNTADDLTWFVTFSLAADAFVLSGYHYLQRRKLLRPYWRRYGIGGIMAWTTITAVAIAALRSVDWSTTAQVLRLHEVWSGVLIDAVILVFALRASSWKWHPASVVAVVAVGSFALLISRLAMSRVVQMGMVYYMGSTFVDAAYEYVAAGLIYQVTFVATLLVWMLGIRYTPTSRRQRIELAAVSNVALETTKSIDLSA